MRQRRWRTGRGSLRPSIPREPDSSGFPAAPRRGSGGADVKTAAIDEPGLKARIGEVLNRWPVAGLAVGVVSHGSLAWFHGHGVADIQAGTRVDQDTVFRIGSITKTITAIDALQLQQ